MQALNSFTVRHWHQGATARLSAAPKAVAPAISTAVVAENKSPYQRRQSRHFRLRKRVSAPHSPALRIAAFFGMLTRANRGTQVSGTPERPRLAVFRSNQHIYAQARVSLSSLPCMQWPRRRPVLRAARSRAPDFSRQVIDDTQSKTLFGLGTVSEAVKAELEGDKKSKTKNKAREKIRTIQRSPPQRSGGQHALRLSG